VSANLPTVEPAHDDLGSNHSSNRFSCPVPGNADIIVQEDAPHGTHDAIRPAVALTLDFINP
jgi:hypothetical protein